MTLNVACSGHVPLQEIIWESLSEPHTNESNSAPTCMYILPNLEYGMH